MACICTVGCKSGMHTITSEHKLYTSDASYELTLGLPHYTYGVQVQYTHIDNEMHRFCSWVASNSILTLTNSYMVMSLLMNI